MPPAEPAGRFFLGFGSGSLAWAPTWTRLDTVYPNLVTSYTIDRGRQFEMDRTDTGRATVMIADTDGVLDPTNPTSPFADPGIEPLLPALIGRRNPVTGTWHTRYRGFVEEYDYSFHPSQRVNVLTISLVDIFEILAAIDLQPGAFGIEPPKGIDGPDVVFYPSAIPVRERMREVLANAGFSPTSPWLVLFTGNVSVFETVYSPGESVLDVVQEAADAEFPGVGNVYTDRFGRLCFHGRLAKFDPETIAGDAGPDKWDWHQWFAGDGAAVDLNPSFTVQLRRFAFNRGLSKVINSASATPRYSNADDPTDMVWKELTNQQIADQLVTDDLSIEARGIRSWSAQSLLTMRSTHDDADSLVETKRFAQFYVDNYADPANRITEIEFRSMHPLKRTTPPTPRPGAAANWEFLSKVDISDEVVVTVASPGGGGFAAEAFFVEGIHEEVKALTPDMDDVRITLDLSPRAYYTINPWDEALAARTGEDVK